MPQTVEIRLPALQEGTESVVAGWLKKPGDPVREHEPLVEINTDKAITEVPSPATGVLAEIVKQPDQRVEPGEVLGRIQIAGAAPTTAAAPAAPAAAHQQPAPADLPGDLSPAVRSLIKQHGVDLSRVRGTGRGGRITHEDVLAYLKSVPAARPAPTTSAACGPPRSRRVPHGQMRRRIAQHMVESMLRKAPHVTAVFEADLGAVVAHRHAHRDAFEQKGVRLTYTAYFVVAAVKALRAVPEVNSRWHDDALEIFEDCNVGVAAALDSGLIVPVIHRAQDLDLFAIASQLQDLTERARQGKLGVVDVQNGTFTITNHGVSGSLIATPIINQPQSAILGVGRLEKRLVVVEANGVDSIQVRPMAYVTLTIDHRALDGFQANRFLTHFVTALGDF